MMYNNKLVASIKANGRILREFKETVYVPFSTEYSILIKNLHTVRAVVNVFIDGEDQVPGGLVLNAGQEIDLQRSVKNGNLNEGNRFKFIEFTPGIEAHRGGKLEDGIVRVEYQYEKPRPTPVYRRPWEDSKLMGGGSTCNYGRFSKGMTLNSVRGTTKSATSGMFRDVSGQAIVAQSQTLHDSNAVNHVSNDAGITVAGGKSNQKFVTVDDFPLEPEKFSIVLKLLGETPDNKPVEQPVTVQHKPECQTCGRKNKATAKFCTECGTALEIFV